MARGTNVCGGAEDGQDQHDAHVVRGGSNLDLSLGQARRNFAAFGSCDEYCARFVRASLPHEHPDSGTPHSAGRLHAPS
ncbi:CPCC family cysteine-rich protein [Streptomyces sp. CA-142005]|uniref:CPCC family cysteine-rich protein n=1 Tax=Streptomyces sp. CA-142005 TaxID=3240052 RepID=UPI003D9153D3